MFSFFGKRNKNKIFKEKRKGRRGNYTFLMALATLVIFALLYFLIPASLVPNRTPTPIPSPIRTFPPLQPTGPNVGGTAIVLPPLQTLQIQALCSTRHSFS